MPYIKLNEVELVEVATESNLLIEENGEIKRVPASNVVTAGGSGGGKVITYTFDSGLINTADWSPVFGQQVVDEWKAGSVLRFAISSNETSNIFNVSYTEMSGAITGATIKYLDGEGKVQSQSL